MELVTGFAGQAHVDPVDMAHVNAAGFGHDSYLLDTQNKLEPTLETANKLVVDTGDLMIQGHHFTVVQSEEIALQSGVSGQKRNALVCARYDKASGTGIETASWVVKYGTTTTGTPADPSVTTGNILDGVDSVHEEPIFRIEYDGITPGDPILLVPEFQSAADYRDSISPDVSGGNLFGTITTTIGSLVVFNFVSNPNVNSGSYLDIKFDFPQQVSNVIGCAVTCGSGSTSATLGSLSAMERELTSTSITARIFNNSGSGRNPWVRVLVLAVK